MLYGYDRSATLDDAATLNDTTRNDATHDDLPTPTTTARPTLNVNADWSLALAVCFIPKSQTCNSYKIKFGLGTLRILCASWCVLASSGEGRMCFIM